MQNTEALEGIKKTMATIIGEVVDSKQSLHIELLQGEQTALFNVYIEPSERGKVIGKKGKMAEALRTILNALSAKNKLRCVMEIVE